jgi:hypothetical protein
VPLPMPTAPWTLNRSHQRGKSQQKQDSTQDATVLQHSLLLQAGSGAACVGITVSGIPNSPSYFVLLHKIYIFGRGFNITGLTKCFSKTGSASINRIKTKGKSTVVCVRKGKEGYSCTHFNLSIIWRLSDRVHAPAALSLGKSPGTHSVGGWVGLRAGQHVREKSKHDPSVIQP